MQSFVRSLSVPFTTLFANRKVIRSFVTRDFRARYISSVLGLSWAVVQPLSLLVLYTFVFSVVLQVRFGTSGNTTTFALYLFCGMLPWFAFSEGVTRSSGIVLDHAHLIKKVVFPSEILPAYVVASALVTECLGLSILGPAAVLLHQPPAWTWLLLPVLIVPQVLFTLGIGWFLAGLNVFFRDVSHLLGLVLTLWMLLTPIFYPPEAIPPQFKFLVLWNPLHYIVSGYRAVLLDHETPALTGFVAVSLLALIAFYVGHWFFARCKSAFADVI